MNIKLTIPERLKDLRTESGLTLEQLSEATGISRAALSKYETDDFRQYQKTLQIPQEAAAVLYPDLAWRPRSEAGGRRLHGGPWQTVYFLCEKGFGSN